MSILCLFKLEMYDSNMAASVIIKYYLTKKIKKEEKTINSAIKGKKIVKSCKIMRLWNDKLKTSQHGLFWQVFPLINAITLGKYLQSYILFLFL